MGAAVLREWRGGISRQSRSRLPARAAPRCSVRAARCQRLRRLPDEVRMGEGDKCRTGTGGSTRRALLTVPAPHGISRHPLFTEERPQQSQHPRAPNGTRLSVASLPACPAAPSRVWLAGRPSGSLFPVEFLLEVPPWSSPVSWRLWACVALAV